MTSKSVCFKHLKTLLKFHKPLSKYTKNHSPVCSRERWQRSTWVTSSSLSRGACTFSLRMGVCPRLVTQSCPIPCDPMACSPPGSSVYGISQARILGGGWPFPTLGDLPDPGIKLASPVTPALAGGSFTSAPSGKPQGWA